MLFECITGRQHAIATAVQTNNIATDTVCTDNAYWHRVCVLWNSSYFIYCYKKCDKGTLQYMLPVHHKLFLVKPNVKPYSQYFACIALRPIVHI